MATAPLPEYWMRGPVEGIAPLLQPVAHALLQAREEVVSRMQNFPDGHLWQNPAGPATPGFHLQHLSGVIDRLFTYAKGESLSARQMEQLKAESVQTETTTQALLDRFNQQVDAALEQLKNTPEYSLTDFQGVGRKQLPSTVMGLLFHAAEHTMRHNGQLLVTAQFLTNKA